MALPNDESESCVGDTVPIRKCIASGIAERLRIAVSEGGGARRVAPRAQMAAGTLYNYLAGRDMKASALVALADACAVSVEWLATGRGQKNAEWINPHALGQPRIGPLPGGGGIAAGASMPLRQPGIASPQASLQAPALDSSILAKAIEIVDVLSSGSAEKPSPIERARKIAQTYQVLTTAESDQPPLPFHTSRDSS